MKDPNFVLEIITGKRKGLVAALIRFGLVCLEPAYRIAIKFRNRKYDIAISAYDESVVHFAEVPVVSVGNLTTGGTGKTPFVIWLARILRERNLRVALISRGYGAVEAGRNDEAREIEHRLTDVPHLQDPDRSRMAAIAVEELESQILVLDDGFQHRQLARDIDIVLIDATCPFGHEHLLPRGLLREPLESLKRADLVVINRINLVPIETVEKIRERIAEFTEFRRIGTSEIIPQNWLQFSGRRFELDHLTGKRILMVCGIGNPDNFRQTLIQIGLDVIQQKIFPDHHAFSRDDINDLGKLAKSSTVDAIVCTHKDLVKIGVDIVAELPVYALLITVELNEGKELLDQLIDEACEKISSQ